jgi:hypothetical protein
MKLDMKSILSCIGCFLVLAGSGLSQDAAPVTVNEPVSLAELPHWPFGFRLTDEMAPGRQPPKGPVKADILVWVPDNAKRIRAFFLVPNNSDLKPMNEHASIRAVARKHECGILYMRSYETGVESEKGDPPDLTRMPALFDFVAKQTGIAEFQHAPWVAFGKSSRGKFPFRLTWSWPERTIGTVVYHGETPTWPVLPYAKLGNETVLHLNVNGESEWGGTWYVHVRPSLLNYRARTKWLPHLAVAQGVGHGDYVDAHGSPGWGKEAPGKVRCVEVWDYIAVYLDKTLALRLPKDQYPTDGTVTLKPVDETKGYLIDPFAVEAMFDVPRLPLRSNETEYSVGSNEESPVDGYMAIPPLKDAPPEGVPVVDYESGTSPRNWLLTDSLKFAMEADPMVDLGHLRALQPKPGDTTTIDGKTLTFQPIIEKYIGPNGGVRLNTGLRPPNGKITLLAYTVVKVNAPTHVKVQAGYTAATRIQMVINGVPVRHKQVLDLQPGLYPMLVVLRMTANWDRIEPSLIDAGPDHLELAKRMQVEFEARANEQARMKRDGLLAAAKMVRAFSDVPAEERQRMFWVADKEQADAWLKLHNAAIRKLATNP